MKKRHLPVLGVGPIYVFTIVIITILGVILSIKGLIPKDECNNLILRIYCIFLGFISIIIGIYLWYQAAVSSKIDKNIVDKPKILGINKIDKNYQSIRIICETKAEEQYNIERLLRKYVVDLLLKEKINMPYERLNLKNER